MKIKIKRNMGGGRDEKGKIIVYKLDQVVDLPKDTANKFIRRRWASPADGKTAEVITKGVGAKDVK